MTERSNLPFFFRSSGHRQIIDLHPPCGSSAVRRVFFGFIYKTKALEMDVDGYIAKPFTELNLM